jgi:hypothetical protein
VGGAIVSLDEPKPPSSWRWGGPDWQAQVRSDVVSAITSVTIQANDPRAMAARYRELFALAEPRASSGGFVLQIDGGELRFVATAGSSAGAGGTEGIIGIGLRAIDRERALDAARELDLPASPHGIVIGGVRFDLEGGA